MNTNNFFAMNGSTVSSLPTPNYETITPEMAKSIIKYSDACFKQLEGYEQRKLRPNVVHTYANDMKEGRWRADNGETIKIDEKGRLIDGQHRLSAVIEANIPIKFLVVRGVDNNTMPTIDVGLKRTLESALQFTAGSHTTHCAEVVKAKLTLDKQNVNLRNSSYNTMLSNSEMTDDYLTHKAEYEDATNFAKKIYNDSEKTLKISEVGGLYAHLVYTLEYDKEYVKAFFERLCSVRTNEKSIYKTTINALKKNPRSSSYRISEYMSCWNSMVKGNVTKRPIKDDNTWFNEPQNAIFVNAA